MVDVPPIPIGEPVSNLYEVYLGVILGVGLIFASLAIYAYWQKRKGWAKTKRRKNRK